MRIARQKLIGLLVLAIAVLSVTTFALPALAAPDCPASGCQTAQVGPFMAGISEQCGEKGTCSLTDIETVFANVGNWILGIVGALVLLAYVVGGFYFLISGMPGMEKYREKGKTALKQSTVGLIIVFVAYVGIQTLSSVLRGGGLGNEGYVVCGPGDTNSGLACGLNSTCTDAGICVSECEQRNQNAAVTAGVIQIYACVDTTNTPYYGLPSSYNLIGSFEKDLCPGGDEVQCGQFSLTID